MIYSLSASGLNFVLRLHETVVHWKVVNTGNFMYIERRSTDFENRNNFDCLEWLWIRKTCTLLFFAGIDLLNDDSISYVSEKLKISDIIGFLKSLMKYIVKVIKYVCFLIIILRIPQEKQLYTLVLQLGDLSAFLLKLTDYGYDFSLK